MFSFLSVFHAPTLTLGENVVTWYQNSLIKELLDYFSTRYFSVQLGTYENFAVSAGTGTLVRNIILALAAAIIVAACVTAYTRVSMGAFVRRLISRGALSENDAKTLMELGYFRDPSIRRALARGSALRMVVRRVGDGLPDPAPQSEESREEETAEVEAPKAEAVEVEAAENEGAQAQEVAENAPRMQINDEKIDFTTARFYIPEALRYRAEIRFDPKGSGWRSAILISCFAIVTAAVLCFFVPELVQLADNIITWLAP